MADDPKIAPKLPPLDKISFSGFKSFREVKDLPLNPGVNLLIGANGSGKSNFLSLFELLGKIEEREDRLKHYVKEKGGADVFLFLGAKYTKEIYITLNFGSSAFKPALSAVADQTLYLSRNSVEFGPEFSEITDAYGLFTNRLKEIRKYHFHDTSPQASVMRESNIIDYDLLHNDAGNLAPFLMRLSKIYPDHFFRIQESVRQVAPFFGEFIFKETNPDKTRLIWKDRFSDTQYLGYQLSDGTIRYICLATLLLQPNPPAIIVIDEPELGLHPQAIMFLASLLKLAAEKVQLIVATQSPTLLDYFQPQDIIVVNTENGESKLERLDAEKLALWLEKYTISELWDKNFLGGLP